MADHDFWLMRESVALNARISDEYEDASFGIINKDQVEDVLNELLYTRSMKITGDPIIPVGSPHPIMSLPANFAPDYFELEDWMFVSQRFRDALAQPPNVVQYWPVELIEASEAAWKQDYLMLRVLAWQSAMDMSRSIYKQEEITNRRTGEKLTAIHWIDRFVPLPGLNAQSAIFRSLENGLSILVTDALAERVMQAGCEGVCFREPATCGMVNRTPRRVRTAYGILVEDADLAEWAEAHPLKQT